MSQRMHPDLADFIGAVEETGTLEVTSHEDNSVNGWVWAEVMCTQSGDSEIASNIAKAHGFALCRVEFDGGQIVFNKKAIAHELLQFNGVIDVSADQPGTLVEFRQDALEETIACITTWARNNECTITHYAEAGDGTLLMRIQEDPDDELTDWKERLDDEKAEALIEERWGPDDL